MYRRLLAKMSPLSFYVLRYGSQYFTVLLRKKMFLIKGVFFLIFVVALS